MLPDAYTQAIPLALGDGISPEVDRERRAVQRCAESAQNANFKRHKYATDCCANDRVVEPQHRTWNREHRAEIRNEFARTRENFP